MINVGDKAKYLGISYVVVQVTDLAVKIKREQKGTVELTVLRGSDRFNAIFPGEVKVTKTLNVDLPDVTIRDVSSRITNTDGEYIFDEEGQVYKFIEKYCKENIELETVSEIKDALKAELENDVSGITRFILTTWANRNLAFKFDFYEIADMLEVNTSIPRTQTYSPKLLEFYLASLQDDAKPTQQEKENFIRLLPIHEQLSYLTCFCGFDWDDFEMATPPLKPKQILELLKEVKEDEPEELTDEDELEELE